MNTFLEDILEQPGALRMVLDHVLQEERPAIDQAAGMIAAAELVVLTSMGSAYYSLAPMAYALGRLHPNVHLVETSELMRQPFFPRTLYVIMSRSGESKEIAEFSARLKEDGATLLVITMTPDSSLARHGTLVIHDPASYDGFICTKAYTTQALVGLLIASRFEDALDQPLVAALRSAFDWMESNKQALFARIQQIDWLGSSLTFLSRGAGLSLAQDGALWLEEAARVRAAYSSIDFFLHGPVEQVDEDFRGVWIDLLPDELSGQQRRHILSKGGRWIVIAPQVDAPDGLAIPELGLPEAYRVIPAAMPVQMIASQSATNLGLNAGEMRYLNWVVK